MSRRVSFSPEPTTSLYTKPGATKDSGGNKKGMILKIWTFKLPKGSRFSPARFFRHISAKVVRAQRFASARRQCWHKVSSASLTKSHSYVETLDSHRAEAIEDCIEFLNSSNASLQRSNSARSSLRSSSKIIILHYHQYDHQTLELVDLPIPVPCNDRKLQPRFQSHNCHLRKSCDSVMCCWNNPCNLITQSH